MFRLYSRTIMLGFVVICLVMNIAYAPLVKGKIEESDEEECDIKEISVDPQSLPYYPIAERTSSSQDLSTEFESLPYYPIAENSRSNRLSQEEPSSSQNLLTEFESSSQDLSTEFEFDALGITTPVEPRRPRDLKELIIDEFADTETMTFNEVACCYKYLLLRFNENDSLESCTSYALLKLTTKTSVLMNNFYAQRYYLYLRTQILVGQNMKSPKNYFKKPDSDANTPKPSSSRFSFIKKGKTESSKQNKDARVSILEEEFGKSAEIALKTVYDAKVIGQFKTDDIRHEYMKHIETTVGFKDGAWGPMEYCTNTFKDNAPLVERQPIYNEEFLMYGEI